MPFTRYLSRSPTDLWNSLINCARLFHRKNNMPNYTDNFTQTDDAATGAAIKEQAIEVPQRKIKDTTWMLANANEDRVVLSLTTDEVRQSANDVTTKKGYEVIASYSWKQTDSPTIYVPGTPSAFSAREFATKIEGGKDIIGVKASTGDAKVEDGQDAAAFEGIQLDPDDGQYWLDQHAQRVPAHQFEPMFQALSLLNPDMRFDDIDVVANRSTLQQLLKVLNNKSSQNFHLDLNMVGTTLFLGRKVLRAKVGSPEGSYGHSFERYFTSEDPELEDAEGHHRMLRYDFGGLDMVVRIEADARIPNTTYDIDAPFVPHPLYAAEDGPVEGIAHSGPQRTSIISQGILTPHFLTIELKSNDKAKPMEQMWFGRTPTCFLGRHKEGLLKRADVLRANEKDFEDWETKYQPGLQKLAWLLRELRTVVKEQTSDGSAVLTSMGKGQPIVVYETNAKTVAVPDEIVERFWDA